MQQTISKQNKQYTLDSQMDTKAHNLVEKTYMKSQYCGAIFNWGDVIIIYTMNGHFICINWKDLKHVLMLTMITSTTNEIGTCQRSTIDKRGRHQ
ncbi:MAG: hypothetical protein GY816_21810 [Cytophagales bacterium]|nr:hypothetical protein [Cytophagales bacterium]